VVDVIAVAAMREQRREQERQRDEEPGQRENRGQRTEDRKECARLFCLLISVF
jgi:hypothetical protein